MTLQHCSIVLRLLVFCVFASILIIFLSLQQHSPVIETSQEELDKDISFAVTDSGTLRMILPLHNQPLIGKENTKMVDYDLYEDLVGVNSKLNQVTGDHDSNVNDGVYGGELYEIFEENGGQDSSNFGQDVDLKTAPVNLDRSPQKQESLFDGSDESAPYLLKTNKSPMSLDDGERQLQEVFADDDHDQIKEPSNLQFSNEERSPKILRTEDLTLNQIISNELAEILNSSSVENTYSLSENDRSQNQTKLKLIPPSFLLESSFKLPWHRSKSVASIMKQQWYLSLVQFLQKSTPNLPIILVAADENFKQALINWLIFSLALQTDPIKNLLILTHDPSICTFIMKRDLTDCIFVPPSTLTAPDLYDHRKYGGLYPLLVVRVVIMRILNQLGYDVANFDSDAILLRNPNPVFERYPDSDVIGTYGGGLPGKLLHKWGVVVCMGAIFMRSTRSTEALWDSVTEYKSADDQIKMNYGIDAMNIKWTPQKLNPFNSSDDLSVLWMAKGKDNLTITLLPQRIACRGKGCTSEVKGQCYIWHHGKNAHKFKNMSGKAKDDGLWRLKKDWSTLDEKTTSTGVAWLKEMMIKT